MARLTADIWVSAYLTRLRLADIPVFVVKKGDATAGAVMIKLNTLDGQAVAYQRQFDLMADRREWVELARGAERDVDAALNKQRGYDPDLWIVEVEDRDGRTLLDEVGLSD
ncbi:MULTISPECIES: DUF1491 family protein [Pacificibacter]|uniref:DUF1491 family protein n=1 Tax=Pacificibacter TaxID=1042323 RepID=UPI001C076038|nr:MULTISPECIES: DUF1491 family protein [Pacificibacter]MBU2866221.1 DUF1491 family protein [Pacificibacter marinus]MBU2937359.1 DUF1491 family protein [Pacificibacter marinus]MDO6615355.1 DUF1491 family protein [Pacificibacter sp. 1_MG-2023]